MLASASVARAEKVLTERSAWNDERTRIYTEQTVLRDDGTLEVRREPGGSVDGIRMVEIAEPAGTTFDFVRSPSKTRQVPTFWTHSCVFLTPDAAGSSHIAGDGETDVIKRSMAAWNEGSASCGFIRFQLAAPKKGLQVAYDGNNSIIFVEKDWCAKHGNSPGCHDMTALTTVWHNDSQGPREGEILDIDVELNGDDFAMATGCETQCVTEGKARIVEDLENTLTHELGHALGLSHTCWADSKEQGLIDENGDPIPSCGENNLPAKIFDATMYPLQRAGEVKKRTPEADDLAGICAIYPIAEDPEVCKPVSVDDGGCAVGDGGGGRGGAATWLLAIGLLLARRRRRSAQG